MKQTHIKKKKKYEINSLIYTLSFLVIYPSKSHFYKCSQTLSFFIIHFLTVFTKHSAFWNSTFSLCTFTKLHFFIMHFFKKLNQTHPKELVEDPMVITRRISKGWKPQLIDELSGTFCDKKTLLLTCTCFLIKSC